IVMRGSSTSCPILELPVNPPAGAASSNAEESTTISPDSERSCLSARGPMPISAGLLLSDLISGAMRSDTACGSRMTVYLPGYIANGYAERLPLSIAMLERRSASLARQYLFETPAQPEPVPVSFRTETLNWATVSGMYAKRPDVLTTPFPTAETTRYPA